MKVWKCVECFTPSESLTGGTCVPCSAIRAGRRAVQRYADALRGAEVRRATQREHDRLRGTGWAWSPAGVDNWTRREGWTERGEARAAMNATEAGTSEVGALEEMEERRAYSLALSELSAALADRLTV